MIMLYQPRRVTKKKEMDLLKHSLAVSKLGNRAPVQQNSGAVHDHTNLICAILVIFTPAL